jgi:hypothetical protein
MRTIRLDPSDTFVFERAAEPGEWAVCGTFAFWDDDPAAFQGKKRSAFRAGFLGTETLGWSTLVQIVDASDEDRAAVVEQLATRLVENFGAPDLATARRAAEEEVTFAQSLCDHPRDTLIAIHRIVQNGEIRETFRTLHPRSDRKTSRVFNFLEVEGEDDDEAAGETVDLKNLAKEKSS